MRHLEIFENKTDKNQLNKIYKIKNPFRTLANFFIVKLANYIPFYPLKNSFLKLSGIKIGKNTAIATDVYIDHLFPELIEIGNNCIIGHHSVILAHETTVSSFRKGKVKIKDNVMIGTNCTVLAGVEIGEGAVVSACSLVNKDLEGGKLYGGVPAKQIQKK